MMMPKVSAAWSMVCMVVLNSMSATCAFSIPTPPSLLSLDGKRTHANYPTMIRRMTEIPPYPTVVGTMMNSSRRDEDVDARSTFLSKLLSRFQGDFDNYDQVRSDRGNGLLPRQGGGHEHFHVTLLPLPVDILPKSNELFPFGVGTSESSRGAVVAAYYFDGMPNRIFRLRMYTLYCDDECDLTGDRVKMKLFTFVPELEGKLRKESESSVETWVDIIAEHTSSLTNVGDGDDDDDDDDDEKMNGSLSSFCTEMERCDILWTEHPDSVRHDYLNRYSKRDGRSEYDGIKDPHCDPVHAIMVNDHDKGGVLLESQMMPGAYIRVQDELSLWDDELWINDRGHDAESRALVYGNWNGVPYQMTRVSTVASDGGKLRRDIVDPNLSWTLGDEWRTSEEYDAKMSVIGGVSTRMNQNQNGTLRKKE